jgi:hypothetical protein
MFKICSVDGCSNRTHSRYGICTIHRELGFYKNGRPRIDVKCSTIGCNDTKYIKTCDEFDKYPIVPTVVMSIFVLSGGVRWLI